MSLLETVLSVVLVGIAAATMLSVVGFVRGTSGIESQRLACTELANRLILMYLDSEQSMPTSGTPIAYGGRLYRWKLERRPVRIVETAPRETRGRASGVSLNRIRQVTVTVWLGEDSGGSSSPDAPVPQVTMSRLFDPLLPTNPDSLNEMLQNNMEGFLNNILESQDGAVAPQDDES